MGKKWWEEAGVELPPGYYLEVRSFIITLRDPGGKVLRVFPSFGGRRAEIHALAKEDFERKKQGKETH